MKRALLIGLPIIVLAYGCGDSGTEAAAARTEILYRVPVAQHVLERETFVDTVEATGLLQPDLDVTLTAEVGGTVRFVAEPVGETLEPGAPVVLLDTADLDLAVERTAAAVARAEAAHAKAQDDVRTDTNLVTQGLAPERQATTQQFAERISAAAIREAKAEHAIAQRQLAKARMVSPVRAVLSETFVDEGEWVSPGTRVARVVGVDQVKAVVYLSELAVAKVALGQEAVVRADTYPGVEFAGTVLSVSPTATPATRTYATEIAIPNSADQPLRPGMAVRVRIVTYTIPDAVVVPVDAVAYIDGQPHVYTCRMVEEELCACAVPVELGRQVGRRVELLTGPEPGTPIVAGSVDLLSDRQPVQVVTDEVRSPTP